MKKGLRSQFIVSHEGWFSRMKLLLLSMVLLVVAYNAAQSQVSLVKDINTTTGTYPEEFSYMTHHKGNLYLLYNNQLWKSDGTLAGTVSIKSFDYITELESSGDYLYFSALSQNTGEEEEETYGSELWRSDGTEEGSIMVKDIYPGSTGSNPRDLINVNGTLFFVANNGTNGLELWKSNGTATGTTLVKDILRVSGSSNPQNLVAFNGKLYFKANDGQKGFELWRSDGTNAGTTLVVDINPASKASSNPEQIVNAAGTLFFFANNGTNSKQLWKSNGELGNATLVKIIRPGGANGLGLLTKVNNLVFFQANDGIHGAELWRSDGSAEGTFMVKDITPGPGSATAYATDHLEYLRESNGRLYFLGIAANYQDLWTSDGTPDGTYPLTYQNNVGFAWSGHGAAPYNGYTYFAGIGNNELSSLELWKTDGTVEGTTMVHENIGDGYANNLMATEMNGKLYFIGKAELWQSDGTREGTQVVKRFGLQAGSRPAFLTDVNGELFFEATDDNYNYSLWKTSGTESGTVSLSQVLRQANGITNVNGIVYFAGEDYRGEELWKSDGTSEGTTLVKDIAADPSATNKSSNPHEFIEFNGEAYFSAQTPYHGFDLWKSNGTPEGTRSVDPAEPHLRKFGNPRQLTKAGGKLFFTADGEKGHELYVYDGVNVPSLTRDIKLHYMGSYPIRLTEFNGVLYFQADNRGNGYELWRSNGTAAGTFIVKDIRREDLGSGEVLAPVDMGNMITTTEALYFTAIKANGKNALWRSDGTGTGTRPYFEFAGTPESQILAKDGNSLTFSLTYDTHVELWKSNGTSTGTVKISDIPEMDNIPNPAVVETLDGVHYFIGYGPMNYHIWRTDGTGEGTYQITFDGRPHDLEVSGGKLYLSGVSNEYGWELFIVNDDATISLASARTATEPLSLSETEDNVAFSNYPNPFNSNFSLRVAGEEDEAFRMNVMNMNGDIIDRKELKYNTEHLIGQSWQNGFYILQVHTGEKLITRKVVKKN
jgi:ELWxxDGT repeat protein